MTRNLWAALADAVLLVIIAVLIGWALVETGAIGWVYDRLAGYLKGRGIPEPAAQAFAAGAVETTFSLVFLTGAFVLLSYVFRVLQQNAARRDAAAQVFAAYRTFVERLTEVRRAADRDGEAGTPYRAFLHYRLAQLGRALDALSTRPLHSAGILPRRAAKAFDEVLRTLDCFYEFTDNLSAWVLMGQVEKKTFYIAKPERALGQPEPANAFAALHDQMLRLFEAMPPPRPMRKAMKGAIAAVIEALGPHARTFVVAVKDRPLGPVAGLPLTR